MVLSDVIRHPGTKKLWMLVMCFLILKNINIVEKHVTSSPHIQGGQFSVQFNMAFQNGLVLSTYMRQSWQTPIIYNFSVKNICSILCLRPRWDQCTLFIADEFRLSSKKPLLMSKGYFAICTQLRWHEIACIVLLCSYIIVVFKPHIFVKFRNKMLTSGVKLGVEWHKM